MTAVHGASLRLLRSDLDQASLAWAIYLAVIAWPESRTVAPNFHKACLRGFARQDIYCEGPHVFLYFPHAAVLFAPFAYLPPGDVPGRVMGIGGLPLAVCDLSMVVSSARRLEISFSGQIGMSLYAAPRAVV